MTLFNLSLGLAGVACVAIPIIIHLLFRRRRKPVLWGAMRFLLEAYRRQRRRLTLEQLLLLAARCLIIALVALAIGRPVLERAGVLGAGSGRMVYLLVDNGLAASALDESGTPALERHKRAATAILGALGPSDRAGLISLGAPADPIVMPASADLGAVRALVEGLEPTDAAADFAGAVERVRAEAARPTGSGPRETLIIAISDFLVGSADISAALPRVGALPAGRANPPIVVFATAPVASAPGNIQIVSVEPLRTVVLAPGRSASPAAATAAQGGAEQVRVRLRRTGPIVSQQGATALRLRIVAPAGDEDVDTARASAGGGAQATVRWQPGQSEAAAAVAIEIPVSAAIRDSAGGEGAAILAEIDRDAVSGDNVFRRPITIREDLRVGVIARRRFGSAPTIDRLEAADWLRLALRPSSGAPIEVVDIEPGAIDAPSLSGLNAALLARPDLVDADGWRRLRQFVDAGGLLVVFPPVEPSVHLWTDAMTSALGLPLRIAREAVAREPAAALAAEQPHSSLLALVEGELPDLLAPVAVERLLPIEELPPGLEVALVLQDGTPLIVACPPHASVRDHREAGGARNASSEGPAAAGAPGAPPGEAAERGLVVYVATAPALSWTTLPAKPFMLPLVQEVVRQGTGRASGSWTATAGSRPIAPAPGRTAALRRIGVNRADSTVLVDDAGRSAVPVRRAGLFRAQDAQGGARGLLAVNADAAAGRTDPQVRSAVQSWLAAAAAAAGGEAAPFAWIDASDPARAGEPFAAASNSASGSPVSVPLLLAALAIAIAETVMARFFSHAFREAAPTALPGGAR